MIDMTQQFAPTPLGIHGTQATAESHAAELARGAVPRLRILAGVFFVFLSLMLVIVHLIGADVLHIRDAASGTAVCWVDGWRNRSPS